MEAPLKHLNFKHRKTPELTDPSNIYTYDSHPSIEYTDLTNSPTAIGNLGHKCFPPIPPPFRVLIHDLLPLC